MTTTVEIREAIMTKLNAVSAIGKTHNYERFAVQVSKMKELFLDQEKILGWILRRSAFNRSEVAETIFNVRNTWELRGYMSLNDEEKSELIFDALTDLVQTVLSNDPSFGGLTSWLNDYELKAEFQPVMFCGVLCHSVIITWDTKHEEISGTDIEALDDFLRVQAQYDIDPHAAPGEHAKWLQEPPNHSTTAPELTETITLQQE